MADATTFSRGDADRILRRAAEIEGGEDVSRMSEAELRAIAGEVGLGSKALERAIAESRRGSVPEVRRPALRKWGLLVLHVSAHREIPVPMTSDQLMRVVRLFQPYRDGSAQVKLEDHEISWRDRKGLRFGITSAGGMTEIRVYVSRFALRRGRWMGWVRAAADRLETLVELVARDDSRRWET